MAVEGSRKRSANVGHHDLGRLVTLADGTKAFLPSNVLVAADGSLVSVDSVSGALTTVTQAHHQIHEREFYSGDHNFPSSAEGNKDFLLVVGANKELHFRFNVEAISVDAIFTLFEGVTASNNGTPVSLHNHHRRTPVATSDALAFHAPTITNTGTALFGPHYISSGGRLASGELGNSDERVLTVSTKYLLRMATQGANGIVNTTINFYEEDPPA